ncbi:MAG: MarC family protein [Deinococcales bacterium]
MTLFSVAITLFLILDPFGNLVMFHTVLQKLSPERRFWVTVREVLIAYGFLMFFLLFGARILDFLNLEQPALSIAGGVLLFLIAIGMVFPNKAVHFGTDEYDEPFIVPLATPLIAGPSVIAFLLLLASKEPARMLTWVGAVTFAWAVSSLILLSGQYLMKLLGPRGTRALERLMGMLLIFIAIQMLLDGLKLYINELL